MIHVIASISVKTGAVSQFLEIFKENIPKVLQEDGCIAYAPCMDVVPGIAGQETDPDLVTIVERWESIEHLRAHLVAPHMQAYKEDIKEIVEKVSIKVLEEQ
jgi:quinol monooxygenase YgiN